MIPTYAVWLQPVSVLSAKGNGKYSLTAWSSPHLKQHTPSDTVMIQDVQKALGKAPHYQLLEKLSQSAMTFHCLPSSTPPGNA